MMVGALKVLPYGSDASVPGFHDGVHARLGQVVAKVGAQILSHLVLRRRTAQHVQPL